MALNGIDVSSFQPDNIFQLVNTDFGIVKVTQGTSYVSPTWAQQATDVIAQGIPLGLYHFADGNSVTAELTHFLSTVSDYAGHAALILDFEADAVSQGETWAKNFLDGIWNNTPAMPIEYGSRSWTSEQVSIPKAGYELWDNFPVTSPPPVAQGVGNFPPTQVPLRQWTSTGRLAGYNGNLDLDVFYGTTADWQKLVNRNAPNKKRIPDVYNVYETQYETPHTFIKAGGDPGTPANWIATHNPTLYTGWLAQIGNPPTIKIAAKDTYTALAGWYLSPVKTSGTIVPGNVDLVVNGTITTSPAS